MFLWPIYVTGNNNTHLGLHVEWSMFLPDFDRLWNFSTDFYRSVFFDPGISLTRTPHGFLLMDLPAS